jgi:A/G-specific adenine glycosylase
MKTLEESDQEFIDCVKSHYATHARDLPWRNLSRDLRQRVYEVVVSEIMLQQTQVGRVVEKYNEWMRTLPNMKVASNAELRTVLKLWSGLGYNRRARYLHELLRALSQLSDRDLCRELESYPGIGPNTAGAIRAYALNMPSVYIETNIRSAIMHHYFTDTTFKVSDKQILMIVERTLDTSNPRYWYWALMDYGSALKKTIKNNAQSSAYRKQSKFDGSSRQLRGQVLKMVTERPCSLGHMASELKDERLHAVLAGLCADKLIDLTNKKYHIYEDRGVH